MNLNNLIHWDSTIFDDIVLPSGGEYYEDESSESPVTWGPMNHQTMVSEIMFKCGLGMPLYTEPGVFKSAVTHWFAKNLENFQKIWDVMHYQYNPIENYNRWENNKRVIDTDTTDIDTNTGNSKTDVVHSENEHTVSDGSHDTTNTISAFNSNEYQPDNKSELDIIDTNDRDMNASTDTGFTYSDNLNNKGTEDTTDTFHSHIHGNIGTTKTQEMIIDEINLQLEMNVYSVIADKFENELMLCLY